MTPFFQWLLSVTTAQAMLGGEHVQLVGDLQRVWEGPPLLKALAAHRELLARLTKRAKRAMPTWLEQLRERLRAELGSKPSSKKLAATEAILAEISRMANGLLQHPPLGPVPTIRRGTYRTWMHPLPPAQRRIVASAMRRTPAAIVALLPELRTNPWLAATTIDLFLNGRSSAAMLLPWLNEWSARTRNALPIDEIESWRGWLDGTSRRPPPFTAGFITYQLGRIADAMADIVAGETGAKFEANGTSPEIRDTPATSPIDPSRTYALKEASKNFNVKVWTLRQAIKRGELKALRPTAAPNAPIQLRDGDIRDWLAAQAGRYQRAPKRGE